MRPHRAIPIVLSILAVAGCGRIAPKDWNSSAARIRPAAFVVLPARPQVVDPVGAASWALAVRAEQERVWLVAVEAGMTAQKVREAPARASGRPSVPVAVTAAQGRCGGSLPSCCTMERESHGNPYAVEPGHAGAPSGDPGDPWHHASGKWQFMPETWNGYQGYPYAAAAPEAVQDDKAREVFAGGAGASHWYGDGCY